MQVQCRGHEMARLQTAGKHAGRTAVENTRDAAA